MANNPCVTENFVIVTTLECFVAKEMDRFEVLVFEVIETIPFIPA